MEEVNHLSLADNIVIMNSDGRIAKQGTFEQLNISNQYPKGLDPTHGGPNHVDNGGLPEAPPNNMPQPSSQNSSTSNDASRQEGDSSVYKFYGASMGWWRLSFYAFSIAFYGVSAGLQSESAPYILQHILMKHCSYMA